MKWIAKYQSAIILSFLLLWQLLLTLQGFDMADTGFHLSAFRFILDDPYSVQYSMMFWLSDITGALWMKLFPNGGLLWARIGWVVAISLTFLAYLQILKKVLSQKEAITASAITLIFILRGGPECLNYDILSSFGFALGLLLLVLGITDKNKLWLFLSGAVFGISIFFKISNITALSFLLIIPFAHFIYKLRWTETIKWSLLWLAGIIAGSLKIIFLLNLTGHWELFTENLRFVTKMGADTGASHGLLRMLQSYISGYINAGVMFCVVATVLFFVNLLVVKRAFFKKKVIQQLFIVLTSLVILTLAIILKESFWSKVRYLFIALMLFYGFACAFSRKQKPIMRIIALAGLILLLIAPLGSDSGLGKSVWGMWLLGPLSIAGFFNLKPIRQVTKVGESNLIFFKLILASIILVSAIVYAWQKTYFDVGSRSEKRYSINHPRLQNIFTTEKKAGEMNKVIKEAFPLISDYDYLLSFIEIPMMNYLADKKPFISTSWPKLYYDARIFEDKLNEAIEIRKTLPAIIRQKQETKQVDWPESISQGFYLWTDHAVVLDEFIRKNNYAVAWDDEMFQLLLPQ